MEAILEYFLPHFVLRMQAHLRDIAGLNLDHHNKVSIEIKQVVFFKRKRGSEKMKR